MKNIKYIVEKTTLLGSKEESKQVLLQLQKRYIYTVIMLLKI